MPFRRSSFSKLLYVQAIHRRPRTALKNTAAPRPGLAAGQCQPDASYKVSSAGDPYFHARARSGAPHFFHFAAAHAYQKVCPPPPPPGSAASIHFALHDRPGGG